MTVVLPDPVAILQAYRRKRAAELRRHVDALEQIASRLVQEDDRLDRLDLGEEERLLAPLAPPVLEQLERRPRRARIPLLPPRLQPLADEVDVLHAAPRRRV